MILTRLSLLDFRNYASLEFAPTPGLNVFVGPNAQGKSNLLEAIAMLGTGRSFRTSRESETIRDAAAAAQLGGDAQRSAGMVRLGATIVRSGGGARKTYTVNGNPVRFGSYLGRAQVVTFVPADVAVVRGGPAGRRSLLNAALAQSVPGYYRHLVRYGKIVAQKSALLRGAVGPDRDLLSAYDEELLDDAVAIVAARAAYVEELALLGAEAYGAIAGAGERLGVRYAPNVETPASDPASIRAAIAARLVRDRPIEAARRLAVVGPHRDDVELTIDGRPIAAFGSQGQQRSATLALKVAEYGAMRTRTGEAPLLLLDDVLSELDDRRARRFIDAVGAFEQAFLTTTEIEPADVPYASRYAIAAAVVTAC